mmetsp:Transcript_9226/g.30450  ORF Transcript_9226/g.30450 Transcript_9226/m.30450 type:complete len:225 (+) Transcript_9226:1104-1778(+)
MKRQNSLLLLFRKYVKHLVLLLDRSVRLDGGEGEAPGRGGERLLGCGGRLVDGVRPVVHARADAAERGARSGGRHRAHRHGRGEREPGNARQRPRGGAEGPRLEQRLHSPAIPSGDARRREAERVTAEDEARTDERRVLVPECAHHRLLRLALPREVLLQGDAAHRLRHAGGDRDVGEALRAGRLGERRRRRVGRAVAGAVVRAADGAHARDGGGGARETRRGH